MKLKYKKSRLKQKDNERLLKEAFNANVEEIKKTWTSKIRVCKGCGDPLPLCSPFFPKNGKYFRHYCGKAHKNCHDKNYKGGGPNSAYDKRMIDSRRRLNTLYNGTKRRARDNDIEFDLLREWMHKAFEEQEGNCNVLGIPLSFKYEKGVKNILGPSVDRIDSNKGYTKDNCQIVCMFVNLGFNNAPQHIREELLSYL